MNILVTGGLGFIGSHTIIELSKSNYNIIVIDNLSNSSVDIIDKIEKMIYFLKIIFMRLFTLQD
jgi:UDP-glucose 4-epimerase